VHATPTLPATRYLHEQPYTRQLLEKLAGENKSLFILTNSRFSFIDPGMSKIVGSDWRDLFDVVRSH